MKGFKPLYYRLCHSHPESAAGRWSHSLTACEAHRPEEQRRKVLLRRSQRADVLVGLVGLNIEDVALEKLGKLGSLLDAGKCRLTRQRVRRTKWSHFGTMSQQRRVHSLFLNVSMKNCTKEFMNACMFLCIYVRMHACDIM